MLRSMFEHFKYKYFGVIYNKSAEPTIHFYWTLMHARYILVIWLL